ncbi:nucleotide exchange factor GrpE [Alloscardovia omnicolens]|uniref:Protein GrpE n=1 Tax=Alloscardovia omnicolens TaxID=419015 RepID=A0A2I1M854_9BIFI|nr:nucleotide exchange factor GrpE [Alloscardovia omnicolens]MDU6532827.1 nucleotide exchange factor GrpE [Alloscardovia omnicolens]PKZ16316.1 nucleotide exchange factor GrpE [Alloscardovia omnicolens]
MSEFNTEDYVNGMDDVDKLANQEKVEQTDHTSPAEQVEETEKASEPSQENSQEQSQDASEDSLTPLGKAKAEAAEYLEALQRERAAFVNFRNRVSKEQDRYREHGVVDVLTALLPALDDIDRIRANSQMDDSFKAVAAKIDKTFEKFGVEKFGEAGEDFDPTHHEGILRKPDADASHETVDTVVEAGYKIGDRVIRAARVVVAVPQDNE